MTTVKQTNATASTDKITAQLNRIQGQVAGISKMYLDGRDCIEIVQQMAAARNALGRAARDVLSGEATRCSRERRYEDLDAVLKEVFRS